MFTDMLIHQKTAVEELAEGSRMSTCKDATNDLWPNFEFYMV